MGWFGRLAADASSVAEQIHDATHRENVRNFVGSIVPDAASNDPALDLVDGQPFEPERSYFSVRIVEVRLAEAGRYGTDFVPMFSCFLRYTYGQSQRTVPYVLGTETIAAGLGGSVPSNAGRNLRFENLYVVRNVPVKADNLVMYAALCRFADSGFARGLLNLLADTAGTLSGPLAGAAVRTAADLTGRLTTLLGADGVQTRFGTLSGNVLQRSGYRVHAGVPASALDAGTLEMFGAQLVRVGPDGRRTTIDDADYLMIAFERRRSLVDETFGQVSVLPFHSHWLQSREKILAGDLDGAKASLTKLFIDVAASPDVTEADRIGIIAGYRAAYTQWTGIESAARSPVLMAGTADDVRAKLMNARRPGDRAAPILGAVLAGLQTGEGEPECTTREAMKEREATFIASRARVVLEDGDLQRLDGADLLHALPALLGPLIGA